MSTLMQESTGSSALAPDVAGTTAALGTLAATLPAITPYVKAMAALRLGPQPLPATEGSTFDPLGSNPALEAQLQTAQNNAVDFEIAVINRLHAWCTGLFPVYSTQFTSITNTILGVITSIGSGTPTAAQRQTVATQFQTLAQLYAFAQLSLAQSQQAMTAFIAAYASDHAALTEGSLSLDAAIPALQTAQTNQLLQIAAGFGGEELVNLIGPIDGAIMGDLKTLANAVDTALFDDNRAGAASASLATAITTLVNKLSEVQTNVAAASDAEFASMVQQVDLQVAQVAWQQLATAAANSGL